MSKVVSLKDLCEIDITDGTHKTPIYSDSGYIFLSSKNVTSGKIDWENVMYIPEELHEELYRRIAPQKDDILLAKNGTTGVAAIVDKDVVFDIYVSLALIRPNKEKVMPKYLLYAINSTNSKRFFDGHLKGVGVPNLHLTHIRETPICVPDFEEQEKIVKNLEHVDNLIVLRKQQLSKLDELVKARFVELFGMVGSDEKGWGIVKLSDCCEINPKKSEDIRLKLGLDVSFIPMPAVSENGEINTSEIKKYDDVKSGFTYFSENDVLFAKITPCMENGKGAIAQGLCNGIGFGSTEFHVLRPLDTISNPYWLYVLTSFKKFRKDAEANMTGSAGQKRVPAKFLENYKISLPPIELQNQFAAFVEQTDKSKLVVQKSLEQLETLKKALMQQYFG